MPCCGIPSSSAFVDAVSFHRRDLELKPVVAHGVSDCGRPTQEGQDDTAHAVNILVLEIEIEMLPEFVESHRPGDTKASHCVAIDVRRARGPFFDISDDLLEEILKRDDSRRASMLVEHDYHLCPLPPHRRQH